MSFETGYISTLSAKLIPADTTIDVATPPTATSGRMHIYKGTTHSWINYTGVSGNTLTGVTFVSQTTDPITVVAGNTFPAGTAIELVEMHDQMLDKQEGGTVSGDVQFDGDVVNTLTFKVPVYADATARDVAIPSPVNGMEVYLTTEGQFYDYQSGAWASRAVGTTTPNASTTVSGKVEIATQAEFDAGTDTGGTGALLSALPSNIHAGVSSQYIAGESIAINDFVMLEIQRPFAFNANSGISASINMGNVSGNTRVSVKIVGNGISSNSLKLSLAKVGAPADSITIRIETDDGTGKPSGTLVNANATLSISGASLTTLLTDTTITFPGSFTLTDATQYHIVAQRVTAVDGANYYIIGGYTRNIRGFQTNTYNGTIWGTAGGTVMPYISYTGSYNTLLVKTNATNSDGINFIGCAKNSVSVGGTCIVHIDGVRKTFSGLTEGLYMLSNTPGAISIAGGTVKAPVGFAEGTSILHVQTKPKISGTCSVFSSSTTGTTTVVEAKGGHGYVQLSAGDTANSGSARVEYSGDGVNNFITLYSISTPAAVVSAQIPVYAKGFYRFVLGGTAKAASIYYY